MENKTYDHIYHCYNSLKKNYGIILTDEQKEVIKKEFDVSVILGKQVRESTIKKLLNIK